MKSKQTHTVQDIETWMYEITEKIQNSETKTEKQALLKKLKTLEQHYNSCKDKDINGKKYPVKKVPKDIPKKELLALIDDVEVPPIEECTFHASLTYTDYGLVDPSGVFISKPQT